MGLNLHSIAVGAISAVNSQQRCTIQYSEGSMVTPDGTRTPSYSAPKPMQAQVQALSWRDLQQLDGLNLQGTRRKIYLYGDEEGIIRVTQQGGDLITFPDKLAGLPPGTIWLITQALETWAGWCCVAVTLQDPASGT
jgi:hypothetical protein